MTRKVHNCFISEDLLKRAKKVVDSSFVKQYPQYNTQNYKQSDKPVYSTLRSYSGKTIDPKLRTDIYQIQETFKDFLKPINEVGQEVKRLDLSTKNKHQTRQMIFAALSPIVPVRRLSSLPDNVEDGNYQRAAGLIALAVVNLPEDTRDIIAATRQIASKILPRNIKVIIAKKNKALYKKFVWYKPRYDCKNYQAPFSFFRGTVLEPIVNKMGKIGVKLYLIDKTLYKTKFGEFLGKIFKFETTDIELTKRFVPKVVFDDATGKYVIENIEVKALRVEGKAFSKLVGRALLRIPVISVFILAALEIPSIIKSIHKSETAKVKSINGAVQILKSGINVVSILSGIGLTGAFLARKGPAGSLIGMGIGSVAGSYVSKFAADKIDDLRKN
jgi:hypothetical protein